MLEARIDEYLTIQYNAEHDQVDIMVDVAKNGEAHVCAASLNKADVIYAIAALSECLHGGNLT